MRVGKSTVGPRVAERAGVPFVDLDAGIVEAAGRSIREIFEADGEGAFRALERDRLEAELSDPTPRVIALGGGALLTRELRLRALERAVVITLEAPLAVLRARAPGDATRPLFDERAAQLLEQRAVVYAEAHARVDATRHERGRGTAAVFARFTRVSVTIDRRTVHRRRARSRTLL